MSEHGIPPPLVVSLLVCERVIVDAVTGQLSLIALLEDIHAGSMPAIVSGGVIHAELTNGRGRAEVVLRIVDANEERPPIVESFVEVTFPSPLVVTSVSVRLGRLAFPEFGEYRVQVVCAGHVLLERRLVVIETSSGDSKER